MIAINRTRIRHHQRNASALLLCTLAAAVLSMAAIAILRSGQRGIARVEARRTSSAGQHVAAGLLQRSVAILRVNPATTGNIVDPGNGMPGAYSELQSLSPSATRIRVFLYAASTTPAIETVVDPTTL